MLIFDDYITTIERWVFRFRNDITSIIGKNVETISSAFRYCENLQEIDFPKLKDFANGAFGECNKLSEKSRKFAVNQNLQK